MKNVQVKIVLEHGAVMPRYATEGSAGADLSALLESDFVLRAGDFAMIPTGVRMEIPLGYECQVRPRSGLASRHGVTVLNSPGTIDSDYRGELKVILVNHGKNDFVIHNGDRIAQIVFSRVESAEFKAEIVLNSTVRGTGGFGSTGGLLSDAFVSTGKTGLA